MSKMGWCLTSDPEQHKRCRIQYTDWNQKVRRCSCDCHPIDKGATQDLESLAPPATKEKT